MATLLSRFPETIFGKIQEALESMLSCKKCREGEDQ
jgi:hypothetical protein